MLREFNIRRYSFSSLHNISHHYGFVVNHVYHLRVFRHLLHIMMPKNLYNPHRLPCHGNLTQTYELREFSMT